jgi:ribosomal protein RSM22 (predicted rRNA methylase)
MNFSLILPHLLHTFKSEHDLIKSIEELSQKFTENRAKITDYLSDKRLVSAYTAFYLTTNLPKLKAVLEWMPNGWLEELKKSHLIDLGAGPGTYSLAFREWLENESLGITQIETSAVMREQAAKLWQGLYPNEKMNQSLKVSGEDKKFLLFGHSANEMGAKKAIEYIEEIGPEHILFIEPGMKDFFPVMLEIREYLIKAGYNVLFPCPEPVACPMSGTTDWCHQFVYVKQNAEIERISQMARKDRRLLPLTVQAFTRMDLKAEAKERLVRVLPETKFSLEWEVCVGKEVEHYQIMKRSYDKKTLKQLDEVLAGAAVETELDKKIEKTKRVKLLTVNKNSIT